MIKIPHFFLKFLYLIKHQANLNLIYKFLLLQITKPFLNFLRSKEKKKFNNFIKNKKFTHNFFSSNCFDWKKNLKKFKINKYLEIGSFEGLSILFTHKNIKPNIIHAVDTWKGSNEYGKEIVFKKVKNYYKFNTKKIPNIINHKMTSDFFFKTKKDIYDLIYIDGLHAKNQVYKDLKNSLKLCHKNTIIICDDFFWKFDKKFTNNLPIAAIIPIIKKENLKIIAISNNQIFLKP